MRQGEDQSQRASARCGGLTFPDIGECLTWFQEGYGIGECIHSYGWLMSHRTRPRVYATRHLSNSLDARAPFESVHTLNR